MHQVVKHLSSSDNFEAGGTQLKDSLVIGALSVLPKNMLSRLVGAAARAKLPSPITRMSVKAFARYYGLDLDEAEHPIEAYRTIGDLFTRRLKPEARPISQADDVVVCPADGRLLNAGRIHDGTLIQAKGRNYQVADLLRNEAEAERFENGSWITVYLSPKDYHRVHHPVDGKVTAARHVPGHLWPVNQAGVSRVDGLFCVNERLITYVHGPMGEVATVMVGATSVGHITVAYDSALVTNRGNRGGRVEYKDPATVRRGDELGIFHLGSTAIVLFADTDIELMPIMPDAPLRMGEVIAHRRH